jgi:hypothetical protein
MRSVAFSTLNGSYAWRVSPVRLIIKRPYQKLRTRSKIVTIIVNRKR